jgi:hypothetical protein
MKFKKTYLSRAMTRAMALDHPIGDPTGGPAYGERRDPVSAIIAVAGMWEAGTIIAGASTLMAGFEALTVAQGLMFAGGALSLVGNVSGNQNLMLLGSAMMLGGGVGGFMSDAGTGFNQTFSEAFTTAPGAELAVTPTSTSVNAPASGTANPAADVLKDSATTSLGKEAYANDLYKTNPEAFYKPAQSVNITPPSLDASVLPAPAPAGNAPLGGFDSTDVQFARGQQVANPNPGNTFGQTPGLDKVDPGIINKAMAFAKENPMAAMVLGQAAGGVATGVMDMASGKTAAQTEQLQADAAYRKSIADKTNRDSALQTSRIAQINANLKAQYPQMSVNANALTIGQQKPAGLINTARG